MEIKQTIFSVCLLAFYVLLLLSTGLRSVLYFDFIEFRLRRRVLRGRENELRDIFFW